ncbi:MAG: outer membrane protein assembly factor BamA [Alphaproteobacteria bacterium]
MINLRDNNVCKNIKIIAFFLFTVLSIFLNTTYSFAQDENVIKKIIIEGNERIEELTVRNYLTIFENKIATPQEIDKSLKKLYSTGLFANIAITVENNNLIVKLIENPLINQIAFEGNKSIKSEDIKNELILKSRSVYTKVRLQHDLNRIADIYHKTGRYNVKITPKIIELSQNRINLIFEIQEGKKTTVKKILFVGNKAFKDSKLSSVITTKESRWYKFLSKNDNYDPYRIEHDKELLKRFYNSKGYAEFKIISANAELAPNKDFFIVTFSIEEGSKYKFGKIDVENKLPNQNLDLKKLQSEISSKENQIYNYDEVEDSVDALTKYLNDHGCAFVNIDPVFDQDNKNNIINIKYIIEEGKKAYLNRINITGNIKTSDKVIRREFRIAEGDAYNASQIARSEQRIKNLDFFDKVDLTHAQTEFPDKYDVNVDVMEKSTSKINIGGGYSATDGVLGQFSITEENFLGKGQQISFGLMKGNRKLDLDLSFTEPYLFDKNLSAGFDIYRLSNDKKNINPYKSLTSGITFRTAYDISEHLTHFQRYSFKKDRINDINSDASIYIKEQEGKYSTSSIGHSLFYDKTNSRIDPTKGYSLNFDQELAGLGGKAKFFKEELNGRYYTPFIKNDFVLQLSGNIGHINGLSNKSVRINERFFIGDVGAYGLRGFAPGGIGPRAKENNIITHTGDPLGGNIFYTASTALSFPLGLPEELDVSGSVFMDAGSLFKIDLLKDTKEKRDSFIEDKSIRMSVGAGLVWVTKLGPIRLDFPLPLIYKKYDRKQYFHINFSTSF